MEEVLQTRGTIRPEPKYQRRNFKKHAFKQRPESSIAPRIRVLYYLCLLNDGWNHMDREAYKEYVNLMDAFSIDWGVHNSERNVSLAQWIVKERL